MITLNIETSTNVCSAAVTEGKNVVCSFRSDNGNHAHDLPLFIDEILSVLREKGKTLDAVSVSAGPGSYTGLRIGVATAKGLCYGLDIPLIAIDTLQVLCASLIGSGLQLEDVVLCPMLDARRMEVYTALYDTSLQPLTEVEAKSIDESAFLDIDIEKTLVFFGNGAQKCKEVIKRENVIFVDGIVPDARFMGLLAEQKLHAGDKADLAYFAPFYLKEFQATVSHKAEDVLMNR
jgi:tRNA threonylcarbamoyladenosine biosynthesis protein TsaB